MRRNGVHGNERLLVRGRERAEAISRENRAEESEEEKRQREIDSVNPNANACSE